MDPMTVGHRSRRQFLRWLMAGVLFGVPALAWGLPRLIMKLRRRQVIAVAIAYHDQLEAALDAEGAPFGTCLHLCAQE